MSIRVKLMVSFLIISFLVVIVGIVGIVASQATTTSFNHIVYETSPSLTALSEIEAAMNQMRETTVHLAFLKLIHAPSNVMDEYQRASKDLKSWMTKYKAVAQDAHSYD